MMPFRSMAFSRRLEAGDLIRVEEFREGGALVVRAASTRGSRELGLYRAALGPGTVAVIAPFPFIVWGWMSYAGSSGGVACHDRTNGEPVPAGRGWPPWLA
jgi:hypothetical protein